MNKYSFTKLEEILADNTSGSSELLRQINNYFLKYFDELPDKSETIRTLQKHLTPFQNIQQYLKQLQRIIYDNTLTENFFTDFQKNSETIYDRIFSNSLPYLHDKRIILTLSNSKTIYEILKRLNTDRKFKTIICESRPKLEGRVLTKKLKKEKIRVEIITEAMSTSYVKKCDCVVIGADAVLRNKNVVNKVGSFQLAVLCNYFQKPFYVITEKSKFSKKNEFKQSEESTDEIWKVTPKGVVLKNFYFEKIPASLISKIITEGSF